MFDRSRLFYILNGQEINRSFKRTPTRADIGNVLMKSIINRNAVGDIQITSQKCHYGYENSILVYRPISPQRFAFLILFLYVRVRAKPSVLCSGVPRERVWGSSNPSRNSEVLTKLSRIPSSVENTSVTE
jgi:hypothetical protein